MRRALKAMPWIVIVSLAVFWVYGLGVTAFRAATENPGDQPSGSGSAVDVRR